MTGGRRPVDDSPDSVLAMPTRPPTAYAFVREFPRLSPDERTFEHHYFLYISRGAVRLRVGGRTWVLPPQRGAWINAGTPIAVSSAAPFMTASVLFSPKQYPARAEDCRVFTMPPLARHLVDYVSRWGADAGEELPGRRAAFDLLAHVCGETVQHRDRFWLPFPSSPALRSLLDRVLEDPADAPTILSAARDASMSVRTLSRALARECGMTWREIVHRARMTRATELLAGRGTKMSAIAQDVGFSSQPAFIAAFRKFSGETPSDFRRRVSSSAGRLE